MQRGTVNLAVFLHGLEARATEFRTVPQSGQRGGYLPWFRPAWHSLGEKRDSSDGHQEAARMAGTGRRVRGAAPGRGILRR